jgi:hypothetical protein
MDLKDFDLAAMAEKGIVHQLYHPGFPSQKLDGKVELVGMDSKTYKKAHKEYRAAIRDAKNDDEKAEMAVVEFLVACTIGWEDINHDGKPLKYSKANAKMMYTTYEWVFEQCNAAVSDRSRFFTKPAKPSADM